MNILFGITVILLAGYAAGIGYYLYSWNRIPQLPLAEAALQTSRIFVSVIIAARNEEHLIGNCLKSLLLQTYPAKLFEIVVVNDHSTDNTENIVRLFSDPRIRLLNLADWIGREEINAYKKKAIQTGIEQSTGQLILTTDADCLLRPDWISTMVNGYVRGDAVFISAPVKIIPSGSFLSIFETLDFISLQGITGAAISRNLYPMCNGANLGYTREAFFAVDGFRGIDRIASGDDMLLLGKINARFPGKARYVKDDRSIVSTPCARSWRSFLRQRIRWASKMGHYKDVPTFITLLWVYLLNACLLALIIAGCWNWHGWTYAAGLIVVKTIIEFPFVNRVANFFGQQSLMKYFPLCQPLHILYTVVAGSFGKFGRYTWKQRKVS